jgi:hypothetical protein
VATGRSEVGRWRKGLPSSGEATVAAAAARMRRSVSRVGNGERRIRDRERERWEVGGRRIIALTYGVHMVPLVSQNLAL